MQATVQVGKNGVKEGLLEALKNAFKKHDSVKVSLLKSATKDRKAIEEIAENLCKALGKHYTSNILGFTIFLKKWRKVPSSKK